MLQYNEVAGRYAGIMFGLSNSISQATGIIVPHFIAAVTKNVKNLFVKFLIQQNLIILELFLRKHKKNGQQCLW